MTALATRTHDTVTFHAVELLKEASALQRAGIDIISLGVGEPDFTAAPLVVEAMQRASRAGLSSYSAPAGLPELREAIAGFYAKHLGVTVDPSRVIVTSGASGALMLAAMALVNPGDEVLMPDPCYPPNRNFIGAAGGITKLIPTTPENRYQLSSQDIAQHWGPSTRGVLIASPSNPTGTSIARDELDRLIRTVHAKQGFVMMDEIYLSLSYDGQRQSALALDDNVIILNSFSKYFNMTGWRLGFVFAPPSFIEVLIKLQGQSITSPTGLSQWAALAALPSTAHRHRPTHQSDRRGLTATAPSADRSAPACAAAGHAAATGWRRSPRPGPGRACRSETPAG